MLILIAGITGMIGQTCARLALASGHQARGLGRSPEKLDDSLSSKLERFVWCKDYFDTARLDRAVKGIDAVIAVLPTNPQVVVAGQLALLLAAEPAGVKIFHAASWNMDWTKLPLGVHETHDAYIAFKRIADISSTIKPIYGFIGAILEFVFKTVSNLGRPRIIDSETRSISYFGDGTLKMPFIAVEDLAAYSLAAVTDSNAASGGASM